MTDLKRRPDGSPRVPLSQCPHCLVRLNTVGQIGVERPPLPVTGDLTVCGGCAAVLTFTRRLRLRAMTAHEIAALDPESAADLHRTQAEVTTFLARYAED